MAYTNTYTKEEQKALAIEKVNRTLEKINTDVASVFNSVTFPEYLEFVARFHYYDVNNTLLIYKQNPLAKFLASFKAWEQFGLEYWGDANRPVFTSSQKGKGIGILAPYILKKRVEDGSSSTRKAVSYFDYHVVFVFDKDQTNNIPVPVIPWDLSKSKEDSRVLFGAFKEKAPFNITFDKKSRPFKFLYKPSASDTKDTLVLNYLDADNYYVLCSYIVKNYVIHSLRNKLKVHSEDEFQKTCECVTFVISSYFGLPADKESFFFVKFWGGNDPKKMLNILNTVQRIAHYLIEILEEEMIFQKSLESTDDVYDDDDIFEFDNMYDF